MRAALNASAFPWSVVTAQVTIHVQRGTDPFSLKAAFWIDADLLEAGSFL